MLTVPVPRWSHACDGAKARKNTRVGLSAHRSSVPGGLVGLAFGHDAICVFCAKIDVTARLGKPGKGTEHALRNAAQPSG
jgi:hypothetical protein